MITELVQATPELTQDERERWFGGRTVADQEDLTQLFLMADQAGKEAIYATLRQWSQWANAEMN